MKKVFILILILITFCSGCSENVNVTVQESNNDVGLEKQNNSIIKNSEKSKQHGESETSNTDMSIVDRIGIPQKYLDILNKKVSLKNDESIMFFTKEDIDLDGLNEIIIAVGISGEDSSSSYISEILVFREENEDLVQIGENLATWGGYDVYELKLISLQNISQRYIYLGLTNGASLLGFDIIELKDNQFRDICGSASATGVGEDILLDINNDGQFDGYTQNRSSYDVLYFPLVRTYILQDKEFVLNNTKVEVPEYPDKIKDVVIQYLSLIAIDAEKCPEVVERISELSMDEDVKNIDYFTEHWVEAVYNTIMEIDEGIEFNIVENGDSAEVTAVFKDNNMENKYIFHLLHSDDRWYIDKIN